MGENILQQTYYGLWVHGQNRLRINSNTHNTVGTLLSELYLVFPPKRCVMQAGTSNISGGDSLKYLGSDEWVSVSDRKCLPMPPSHSTLKYFVEIITVQDWKIETEDGWFQQLPERVRILMSTAAEWKRGWKEYVLHGDPQVNSPFIKRKTKACSSALLLFCSFSI